MTDSAVPTTLRTSVAEHGLPHDENQKEDEYFGTPGWSSHLYVRACRTIIGKAIVTEPYTYTAGLGQSWPDPMNLMRYHLDSWPHSWYALPTVTGSKSIREGGMATPQNAKPWQVPFRACQVPQADNLLVCTGVSVTEPVYNSMRIEPTWMNLGEACGLALVAALDAGMAVATLPYARVRRQLDAAGAILST